MFQRISLIRVVVALLVFTAAVFAGTFVKVETSNAGSGSWQKDNFWDYAGYYMHQWLITDYQNCCSPTAWNFRYRYGHDSRWSWGGAGHNVDEMGMLPRRAWRCGILWYSHRVTVYNTYYQYYDSPWTGWQTCGAQADFTGRIYKYGVFDWWPYLNF